MKHALTAALLLCLFTPWTPAATNTLPPPAPDDPLIMSVAPRVAQQGQQVVISGFNYGDAPQVTFNGVQAQVVGLRGDKFMLVAVVPPGATSGPVVMTNTNTAKSSNAAEFTVAPGTYTPVCTISGTVSDPGQVAVADTLVIASDSASGEFRGIDLSDAGGNYSIAVATGGTHRIAFRPPHGTPFLEHTTEANCPGVLNHQFETGSELSGTVIEAHLPYDPVPNSIIWAWSPVSGAGRSTVTDAAGDFSLHLPDDTYNLFVASPIGGRQIATYRWEILVSGDTSVGDVPLEIGWILSGVARHRSGPATGPMMFSEVQLGGSDDSFDGHALTIADGSFWLAGAPGTDQTLWVYGHPDLPLLTLEVRSIDLTSDAELDHTLTAYSPGAQSAPWPRIIAAENLVLQEGQLTAIDGVNLGGTSVAVRFPDGVGGWVDGDETHVDPDRGLIVTRAPSGAVSGNVHVRADGVDGPGYPLTINPGVFDPGSYTISGTVTDGSTPQEGVLVVLARIDCGEDRLAEYDVTDAAGAYSVYHATGDYILYIVPPVSSGLAVGDSDLSNLTGDTVANVVLEYASITSGRVVDSGVGPVGATSAPIRNSLIVAEGPVDEEWVLSRTNGDFSMHVLSESYEVLVEGPPQSRYLERSFDSTLPTDLGDIALDSGYFLEGYVVDETGAGLAGIEVYTWDTQTGDDTGSTMTVGDDGWFRMSVPAGTHNVGFWGPDDLEYSLPNVQDVNVWTDTLLHPQFEAQLSGHIQGTVTLADGTTPVAGVSIWAFDFDTGQWVEGTDSCEDGTYDMDLPSGTYSLLAWPNDPCLATERYDETHYGCEYDPVPVVSSLFTTGIDFTLDPGGDISGRVVDGGGAPVPNVEVCVDDGPGGPCSIHCDWTEGDGSYYLDYIPVGSDRRVYVNPPSGPPECWDDHLDCVEFDPVVVSECLETADIDFGVSSTAGPVPDGAFVPGTPLTAGYNRSTQMLTVNWQPTCNAENHVLYYGNLGSFGAYTTAICSVGMAGTITTSPPSGDIFFLVAGHTWSNEGSYGRKSNGIERPSAMGAHCGYSQDLSNNCMP